jgi:hypothetical protein
MLKQLVNANFHSLVAAESGNKQAIKSGGFINHFGASLIKKTGVDDLFFENMSSDEEKFDLVDGYAVEEEVDKNIVTLKRAKKRLFYKKKYELT